MILLQFTVMCSQLLSMISMVLNRMQFWRHNNGASNECDAKRVDFMFLGKLIADKTKTQATLLPEGQITKVPI